jgi:hypothetical protein
MISKRLGLAGDDTDGVAVDNQPEAKASREQGKVQFVLILPTESRGVPKGMNLRFPVRSLASACLTVTLPMPRPRCV